MVLASVVRGRVLQGGVRMVRCVSCARTVRITVLIGLSVMVCGAVAVYRRVCGVIFCLYVFMDPALADTWIKSVAKRCCESAGNGN